MTEKWKKEAAALKEARQHLLAQLGGTPFPRAGGEYARERHRPLLCR